MWEPNGLQANVTLFGSLTPVEVLYEYDGPRIFSCRDAGGQLMLAYLCDEDEGVSRYLVVPTIERTLQALQQGRSTVREALHQPWAWIVDEPYGQAPSRAWQVDVTNLPEDILPRPGVCLDPSHEPLFAVRLMGDALKADRGVPASVVRRAVDGASSALKILVDWVAERDAQMGRPIEAVRRLYDLPARQFRFASFEVAFGAPEASLQPNIFESERDVLEQVGKLLNQGLAWASSERDDEHEATEEWQAILAAVQKLAPPKTGIVSEVQVKGRLLGQREQPLVLTRRSTDRVRVARERLSTDLEPVKATGRVRELDKDKLTLTLRDAEGAAIFRCAFPEELLDDAQDALVEEKQVVILGHKSKTKGTVEVVSIDLL